MRRDERAVFGVEAIFDILNRCDTVRLGVNGEDGFPYVIPMTFGCALADGAVTVYFHCAGAGRKWEILQKDPRVCVEADLYYKTVATQSGGLTANYESVIGWGDARRIVDRDEKVRALKVILDHYKESGFPVTSCKGLPAVEVFAIRLDRVTGKHNLNGDD